MKRCPLAIEPCRYGLCRYFRAGEQLLADDSCLWWATHAVPEGIAHRGSGAYAIAAPVSAEWARATVSLEARKKAMKVHAAKKRGAK
jgi:hypothetical protein